MTRPETWLRLTIVLTDFILWLFGIAILAMGSFLKLSNYVQYTISSLSPSHPSTAGYTELIKQQNLTSENFNHFSWVLILIGLFLVGVAILGACSVSNGQILLLIYSCLIFCSMFGQTLIFLIYNGHLGDQVPLNPSLKTNTSVELKSRINLKNDFSSYVPFYIDESFLAIFSSGINVPTGPDGSDANGNFTKRVSYDISPIGTTIITIQNSMKCCGYFNACDFCPDSKFSSKACFYIPNTCKNICPKNAVDHSTIYEFGCKEAFYEYFKDRKLLFEIIIMFWLILQFLVGVFALILCCVNRKIEKDRVKFRNDHVRYQNEQEQYNNATARFSIPGGIRGGIGPKDKLNSKSKHRSQRHSTTTTQPISAPLATPRSNASQAPASGLMEDTRPRELDQSIDHNQSQHDEFLDQSYSQLGVNYGQHTLNMLNTMKNGTIGTVQNSTLDIGTSSRTDNEILAYHDKTGLYGQSQGVENY